jgi:hypothetical protein
MSDESRPVPSSSPEAAPAEPRAERVAAEVTVATPRPDAVITAAEPAVVTAEMLVLGLQQLHSRVPGFVHLTPREARSMSRAANLDEDFANAGIHAASLWADLKGMTRYTAEELREMADEARRWDEVERELRIALKGITHANIVRRHRFGQAILFVYTALARLTTLPEYFHLRPYYEEMKRLYLRATKARGKKGKEKEGEEDLPQG